LTLTSKLSQQNDFFVLKDCLINVLKQNIKVLVLLEQYQKKYWYWYCNPFFEIYVGTGIGNTFCKYCQYF